MSMDITKKSFAAVAAVCAAAGLIGGAGLSALFTDTAEKTSGDIVAGTVQLSPGMSGSVAGVSFETSVADMAPGDTTYRFVSFENAGSLELGRIEARVVTSGELADKGKTGLPQVPQVNGEASVGDGSTPVHMKLTACAGGDWTWLDRTTAPVCGGTATDVLPLADTAIQAAITNMDGVQGVIPASFFLGDTDAASVSPGSGRNVVLYDARSGGTAVLPSVSMRSGEKLNYMVTYHLPVAAKNEYQGTTAKTKLFITATQRDGRTHGGA